MTGIAPDENQDVPKEEKDSWSDLEGQPPGDSEEDDSADLGTIDHETLNNMIIYDLAFWRMVADADTSAYWRMIDDVDSLFEVPTTVTVDQ